MLKELFASIGIFVASIFGGGDSVAAVPPSLNQPASAIVALNDATDPASVATSSATTTIINQYVTQPIIEHEVLVQNAVTREELNASLAALRADLLSVISGSLPKAYTIAYPAAAAPVSTQTFAYSQRIDNLSSVTISNSTIDTASIPDLSGSYLSVSGGTVLGSLNLTSASTTRLSIFSNAYFGSTATSTFDSTGALTLASPLLVSSGGTGANTFSQGWIYSNGGTSTLAASTSPTVNYITATSTTASSTIAGGLSVSNSSTLLQEWKTSSGTTTALLGYNTGYANAVGGYLRFPSNLAAVQPSGGNAPLGIYTGNLSNLGVYDPVISIGYNNAVVGSVLQSGENALSYNVEGNYRQSDGLGGYQNVMEAYLQYNNTDGTWWRPFFWQINRADGSITNSYITGNPLTVKDETGASMAYIQKGNITVAAPATGNGYLQVNAGTGQYGSLSLGYSGNNAYFQAYTQNGATIFNVAGTRIATLYSAVNGGSGAAFNVGGAFNGNGAIGGFNVGNSPVSTIGVGIQGRAGQTGNLLETRDSNGAPLTVISPTGRIGIGTTSPYALLSISNSASTAANTPLFVIASTTGGTATTTVLSVASSGNVGIATTSPWRALSVMGTVGFDGLTGSTGAGSLCLTASKEVVYNSGSDACLPSLRDTKHDISSLSLDALQVIDALDPVSFVYNESDGRVRYGFIAEDTAAVDSHLVTYSASGTLSGIDDRSIISIIVKAIQELRRTVDALVTTVTGFADKITTKELCVGSTCVNESQLQALLANAATASNEGDSLTPAEEGEDDTADTEAPVITINGNNPATLQVGDAYNDLGATATDNVDTNLGIRIFVGSTPFDQVQIDTSEPNEWHIHYVATDNSGNTATSTRTVIVEAPSVVPSDTPVEQRDKAAADEPQQEGKLVAS